MSKEKNQQSLLEKLGRVEIVNFIGVIIFFIIFILVSISTIFLGIGFSKFFYVPGLVLVLFFVISIIIFSISYPTPRYFKQIKKLASENNEKELLEIASKINQKSILALYALFDIQSSEAKTLLRLYIDNTSLRKKAEKLTSEITTLDLEIKIIDKNWVRSPERPALSIPIDKVYFIKSPKELSKCMISKIQLTLDAEVVICPYCSNMVKKDLMTEWLNEKNTCPVCFTQMTIDDCPIVDIRDH
ncbi:MAG: hypothetical protein FK732_07730 [Asgard group archaeon]|nr:hypothetical protein [Asgard group archaeon]